MSFGAINNKYENRQYNCTMQKKATESTALEQQKIKNKEMEESYKIGVQTFTIKEWKEFLDKFDSIQEELKELMRERHRLQEEERMVRDREKKKLEEEIRYDTWLKNRELYREFYQ